MSDPVTNVEIEDVLSSIRRLVSSDDRPKAAALTPVGPAPAEHAPERLVLTPSLRIDSAAPAPEEEAQQDAPEDDTSPLAEFVAGDDMRADDPGPEEEDAAQADPIGPGPQETDEPSRDPKAELRARVAELEEVVSRQGDQWEPDGALADANAGCPDAPLPWEDYVTAAEDDGAREDYAAERSDRSAREEQRSSLLDDDEGDPDAGEPLDDVEHDFLSGSDEFLDEDALRDLVADIVREELQGALGERITRNVRKLVRREIHRALTSQDFE